MPKPFPKDLRRDVIAVACKVDQSIAQVARSFGVSKRSFLNDVGAPFEHRLVLPRLW